MIDSVNRIIKGAGLNAARKSKNKTSKKNLPWKFNMSLIKYFNCSILIVFCLNFPPLLFATVLKKRCGESLFIVEISNEFDQTYKLYYKTKHSIKNLFFKTDPGVLVDVACIKDKEQKELLLFLEISGGNAGPEDRYRIFDPETKKMLIEPVGWSQGNYKQVERLIGYPPPFPSDDEKEKVFFCCSNIYTPNN